MGALNALSVLDCEDIAWFRDDESVAASARGAAATLARRVGLSAHRASEVALAVSEAATNLRRHAVDGSLLLRVLRSRGQAAVEFVTVDAGPGIDDLDAAMSDGNSTAGTLGIGLGAVARLADVFDIHSLPGRGTVMAAQFWPRGTVGGANAVASVAAGITRPISGETTCGDAWAVRVDPGGRDGADGETGPVHGGATGSGDAGGAERGRFGAGSPERSGGALSGRPGAGAGHVGAAATGRFGGAVSPRLGGTAAYGTGTAVSDGPALLAVMCDGLGHGPQAALAGEAALKAFRTTSGRHPEAVMGDIHRALRGTRGGAVAVARIEPERGRLLYCGVGNISGFLVGPDSRSGLTSAPGIVGQQMRGLRTFEYPLAAGGALVMHSDGLTEKWTPGALPGLLGHLPAVVAGQLLREAAVRRDDAGIVVVKGAW
ncbi:ATP-binding SpoIIE family protein phosphatase [Streptantibioticus silvisoli]|uniref:ATP-binding protein/SpoIIE family protein phosphatase n=1 Tax=Streptantibioticus silvisoli TaxID=2705255 RepID=A0ABT6W160_9ACTN|nr:ATP-binding SpoIIE family protein phosphatase [Streptantibioticus silvisoli]MDI5964483.1 ATP-binding protein/SpoIIE family protein phosphatase [Streptantibioticus silvisoli]